MITQRFASTVLDGHKGLAFEIPFDPSIRWHIPPIALWPGRRGHRVRGTVNRVPFESVAGPRARRFFVLVNDRLRLAARLRAGSKVKISLAPAT